MEDVSEGLRGEGKGGSDDGRGKAVEWTDSVDTDTHSAERSRKEEEGDDGDHLHRHGFGLGLPSQRSHVCGHV